jgi:hypothetical protein
MISQPSIFARTALVAAIAASLIVGAIAATRPGVQVSASFVAEGP